MGWIVKQLESLFSRLLSFPACFWILPLLLLHDTITITQASHIISIFLWWLTEDVWCLFKSPNIVAASLRYKPLSPSVSQADNLPSNLPCRGWLWLVRLQPIRDRHWQQWSPSTPPYISVQGISSRCLIEFAQFSLFSVLIKWVPSC